MSCLILQNRGGPASTSKQRSFDVRSKSSTRYLVVRPRPRPPPLRPSPRHRPSSVPSASLWESLFGGGGNDENKRAKEQQSRDEDEGEGEDVVLIDPDSLPPSLPDAVVARTFLSGRPLAVAYRASRDGWSALDFHARCDFKGPCLIVAEVESGSGGGTTFGAYYSDCLQSSDDYKSSFKPFLFAFDDDDDDDDDGGTERPLEEREIFVCEKVGGPEAALFDYRRGGPQFGSDGLLIGPPLSPVMGGFAGPDSPTQGAGDLRTAKSRLGLSYAKLPPRKDGKRRGLFGKGNESDDGRDEARLREVTVFYSPELARMYR